MDAQNLPAKHAESSPDRLDGQQERAAGVPAGSLAELLSRRRLVEMGAATGLAASFVGLASSAANAAQDSTPAATPSVGDTAANLQTAIAGEAQARLKYMAYGLQAMQEGHPEIAQLFFEAAGAETVHGINHMKVAGAIKSTEDNLNDSAYGENYENEVMYPQFIEQARAEGREDAAATFQLAMERELYHRDMFRQALETFQP